jgi:GxxExxY protein
MDLPDDSFVDTMLLREETYRIRGAVFEVYRTIGCGFLESVYQESLEFELEHRRIPFHAQMPIQIMYHGRPLTQTYKADFLCFIR